MSESAGNALWSCPTMRVESVMANVRLWTVTESAETVWMRPSTWRPPSVAAAAARVVVDLDDEREQVARGRHEAAHLDARPDLDVGVGGRAVLGADARRVGHEEREAADGQRGVRAGEDEALGVDAVRMVVVVVAAVVAARAAVLAVDLDGEGEGEAAAERGAMHLDIVAEGKGREEDRVVRLVRDARDGADDERAALDRERRVGQGRDGALGLDAAAALGERGRGERGRGDDEERGERERKPKRAERAAGQSSGGHGSWKMSRA